MKTPRAVQLVLVAGCALGVVTQMHMVCRCEYCHPVISLHLSGREKDLDKRNHTHQHLAHQVQEAGLVAPQIGYARILVEIEGDHKAVGREYYM